MTKKSLTTSILDILITPKCSSIGKIMVELALGVQREGGVYSEDVGRYDLVPSRY